MAKGIIVNVGTGGAPPKMIITDFDPSQKASYAPGKEMLYVTSEKIEVGFLVEGNVTDDGKQLTFTVTKIIDSNPTVITGNSSGNITIGINESYLVQSTGQITGNVTVNGGVLLVNGGKASGNISINSNSTIICINGASVGGGTFDVGGSGTNASVAFQNTTVNGKFSTNGITFVNLAGNNFNGNLSSVKDGYVSIVNNTVNKDLVVSQVVNECKISANTVAGSTTIDPICQP